LHNIRNLLRILAFLTLALIAPVELAAQTAEDSQVDASKNPIVNAVKALQEQVKVDLQKAAVSLEELRKKVDQAATVDAQLAELKIQADEIGKAISGAMGALESRYNLVSKRLDEIGQPPAAGQPAEDAGVSGDRKRLQDEKSQMNTILTDADVVNTEAGKLSGHITDLRRKLFTETLLRRTHITPEMLEETATATASETDELVTKTASSLKFMWNFKRQGLFAALLLSLGVALLIAFVMRRAFAPLIRRETLMNDPPYISRLSKAFWSTLIPTLGVSVFVMTSIFFLDYFKVLRDDISQVFQALLWVCAIMYFVFKLCRAIVAPGKPAWRLTNVSDRGARMLVTFALLMTFVISISFLTGQITEALDSPVVLTVARGFISAMIIGVMLLLLAFVRPMKASLDNLPDRPWPQIIRISLIIIGAGLIVTALTGYIGLAQFAATQIVMTGALGVTMYIGILTGQAVSRREALAATAVGRLMQKRHGLTDVQLDQFALVAGLAIYALVFVLFVPGIMLQWGFQGADIGNLFVRLFTEIHVGNITISLLGVFVGILVFIGGYFLTRWFQRWLDGNVMARSQIDIGVRNSVNTALGYAGVAFAGLIGISAAGIDLSSLALVAGALSLGIGFGLQTIVQNFVSGLILLAERPFKVGDWIVNGPVEGFVRRISVRATEVETFQNQSIIVPNSQLINAAVGNWTLRNTLARSEIPVSVSYDSDPQQVMDILMEIATNHPLVLTMPEPNIGFQGFGQFSMDFELRFYLADLFQGGPVKNEIRVAIIERFRKEGIVIPVPQRNINVRFTGDGAELEKALAEEGLSAEAARRVRLRAEYRGRGIGSRTRELDLVDDDSGPHDGLHHASSTDGEDHDLDDTR
jgi:potassium efflux system protein